MQLMGVEMIKSAEFIKNCAHKKFQIEAYIERCLCEISYHLSQSKQSVFMNSVSKCDADRQGVNICVKGRFYHFMAVMGENRYTCILSAFYTVTIIFTFPRICTML